MLTVILTFLYIDSKERKVEKSESGEIRYSGTPWELLFKTLSFTFRSKRGWMRLALKRSFLVAGLKSLLAFLQPPQPTEKCVMPVPVLELYYDFTFPV